MFINILILTNFGPMELASDEKVGECRSNQLYKTQKLC